MAGGILLSICIPTMNRERFLHDCLQSIISQQGGFEPGRVEICIFDSGSDGTEKMVRAAAKKSNVAIRYARDPKRIGVDRSIMKVALMGRGKFCWLLSDDDIAEPGAVASILSKIEEGPDCAVIELNKWSYSLDLKLRYRGTPPCGDGKYSADAVFKGENGTCEFVTSFFYDFSYMSAHVVNRRVYGNVVGAEKRIDDFCGDYLLAYTMCRMLERKKSAVFISTPCLGNRQDNETSFSVRTAKQGGEIDQVWFSRATGENFRKVAQAALPAFGNRAYGAALSLLAKYHVRSQLMTLKGAQMPFGKKLAVWKKVLQVYYHVPEFWLYAFPFIIMPQPVFFALRIINRSVVKPSQSAP